MARFISYKTSVHGMYDYLSSKLVWIIAAVVMTSSVLGLFVWQRESSEELELEIRANGIRDMINEFCNTNGEVKAEFSSSSDTRSDFELESTINGESYKLNFTASGIFLEQDGRRVWKNFIQEVYLYNPVFLGGTTSQGTLDRVNLDIGYLSIPSYQDFYVEVRRFDERYNVFIHHEGNESAVEEGQRVGDVIDEVTDWSYEEPEREQNMTIKEDMIFMSDFYYVKDDCLSPMSLENIYLFEPGMENTTWEGLEEMANENDEIRVMSGDNITVRTKMIEIEDAHTVLNFLYT